MMRDPYDRVVNPHQTDYVARIIVDVDRGVVDREIRAAQRERQRKRRRASKVGKRLKVAL